MAYFRLEKNLAEQLLELLDAQFNRHLGAIQDGRVVLGGSAGSAGGVGDPPAGFWGQLRQGNVTYDTAGSYRACTTGSAGSASLVDNLDRIRLGWDLCPESIKGYHIDWETVDHIDLPEIEDPAAPPEDMIRIYGEDFKGFSFLNIKGSDDVTLRLARDNVFVVRNTTGSLIEAGAPVYVTGSSANVPSVALAQADASATMPAVGLTIDEMDDNAFGRVMQIGLLHVDTSAFLEGDVLYVSPLVAGGLTTAQPVPPDISQEMGVVLVSGVGNGVMQSITQSMITSGGGGGGTLDDAYDYGGAGAGRIIIADTGAVEIQGAGGLKSEGDVVLDDGAGDSPSLKLIGGSNDDTALIFLDDNAVAGTSDLVIRLVGTGATEFRVEDSAGNYLFTITPTEIIVQNPSGNPIDFTALDGVTSLTKSYGALTEAPVAELHGYDDITNTVVELLRLKRTVALGYGANGLGGRVLFQLEDSAGNIDNAGAIDTVWEDATSESEDSCIQFLLRIAGAALAEVARLDIDGLRLTDNKVIDADEQNTPGNPAAGRRRIYPKADGWYDLDSAGIETKLGNGGGFSGWGQVKVVAKSGGDYTSVADACAAIVDSAANKPYAIMVMAGIYTEAADISVPQYVTMLGQGESTIIDMQGKSLGLGVGSSLMNLVIKGTGNDWGWVVLATNAVLWNVRGIITPANNVADQYVFLFTGASSVKCYHVKAETTAAAAGGGFTVSGFGVSSTATVELWDCQAADTTNFDWGLLIANSACTVNAYNSRFRAKSAGKGIELGAAAALNYFGLNCEPANCTISGKALPLGAQPVILWPVTRTVGAGKDFSTIQSAINWFKGKLCVDCVIAVDAGTYAENLVTSGIYTTATSDLVILGDTRILAGLTYVSGSGADTVGGNRGGLANGGTGNVTLSNAGNNITVTMTTANPNFGADGWGNGDKVIVRNNAGAITEYTVNSVLNNVITLTAAAPAVGNLGTAICLLPNRRLAPATGTGLTNSNIVGIDGFTFVGVSGQRCILSLAGTLAVDNVCCWGGYSGIYMPYVSIINAEGGALSFWNHTLSVELRSAGAIAVSFSVAVGGASSHYFVELGGSLKAVSTISVGAPSAGYYSRYGAVLVAWTSRAILANYGFYSIYGGSLDAYGSVATTCTTSGFHSQYQSYLRSADGAARNNGVGNYAGYNSYILATGTNANNFGNTTNYSPAASDTEGNVSAIITWS